MDYLWSPWRFQYVSQVAHATGCIFCQKPQAEKDEENLIFFRGVHNFGILNLYPYTTGHLMIVPYQHAATLNEASTEALGELMQLMRRAEHALTELYRPRGINAGMNIGECAGAGIAGHIHMHVLPRWPGDVNFMTAIGETRVLVEDIGTTYAKLKQTF
jgi:ATP adenylyltransferase